MEEQELSKEERAELRARYNLLKKEREPALKLVEEVRKNFLRGRSRDLTMFVAQLAIETAMKDYNGDRTIIILPLEKDALPLGVLEKIQGVERVFSERGLSCNSGTNDAANHFAEYNPLVVLEEPDFYHPNMHNNNIVYLFSPGRVAGYYDTAIACLGKLLETVQQRDFSPFGDISFGSYFYDNEMRRYELAAKVGLEITNPTGPDYITREFSGVTTKHPLDAFIADVLQRAQIAKEKAVQVFNPDYRDAFLLESAL